MSSRARVPALVLVLAATACAQGSELGASGYGGGVDAAGGGSVGIGGSGGVAVGTAGAGNGPVGTGGAGAAVASAGAGGAAGASASSSSSGSASSSSGSSSSSSSSTSTSSTSSSTSTSSSSSSTSSSSSSSTSTSSSSSSSSASSSSSSSSSGSPGSYDTIIGTGCSSDFECTAILDGYCATGGAFICTKACFAFEDCGCPLGTTLSDIAAGLCEAVCTDVTGYGDAFCLRPCQAGACEGATYCDYSYTLPVCKN